MIYQKGKPGAIGRLTRGIGMEEVVYLGGACGPQAEITIQVGDVVGQAQIGQEEVQSQLMQIAPGPFVQETILLFPGEGTEYTIQLRICVQEGERVGLCQVYCSWQRALRLRCIGEHCQVCRH